MSKVEKQHFKHGDTLVEVMLALTIFASLAVMAIHTMNSGMYQAERAIEITMARNEIDAQAEALRFIQNNYVAEREHQSDRQQYSALWNAIIKNYVIEASDFRSADYDINASNIRTCDDAYNAQMGGVSRDNTTKKAFAINTRLLEPSSGLYDPNTVKPDPSNPYSNLLSEILIDKTAVNDNDSQYILRPAPLYPRGVYSLLSLGHINDAVGSATDATNSDNTLAEDYIYRKAESIEGIWIVAVKGDNSNIVRSDRNAEYYDFYIRSCWQAVGLSAPSTLTTIVRLYNPEVID